MANKIEFKEISFEIKDFIQSDSGDWIVEGFASTEGVDTGDDKLMPGAFTQTIQERFVKAKARNGKSKIKFLWQHNPEEIIGSVLELEEVPGGLYIKVKLIKDPLFKKAARAYHLLKIGELDSFSIGFNALEISYEIINDVKVRLIHSVKLYEISLVTFPMNEEAEVTSVKKLENDEMNEEVLILLKQLVEDMQELKKKPKKEDAAEEAAESPETEAREDESAEKAAPIREAMPEADALDEEAGLNPKDNTKEASEEEMDKDEPAEEKAIIENPNVEADWLCPNCGVVLDPITFEPSRIRPASGMQDDCSSMQYTKEEILELITKTIDEKLASKSIPEIIEESKNDLEDFLDFFLTKEFKF